VNECSSAVDRKSDHHIRNRICLLPLALCIHYQTIKERGTSNLQCWIAHWDW